MEDGVTHYRRNTISDGARNAAWMKQTHRQMSEPSHPGARRGPVGAQNQAQHISVDVLACDRRQVPPKRKFSTEHLQWKAVRALWYHAHHKINMWCSISGDVCPNLGIISAPWPSEEPVAPATMGKTWTVLPPSGWKVKLQHFKPFLWRKKKKIFSTF